MPTHDLIPHGQGDAATTEPPPGQRRRWDPLVKLTHWTIALAVLANAIITEEGSGPHVWVGYGLAAILGLRLLWGLIGPAEARFSAFAPSLRRALAHVGDIVAGRHVEHRSHNPLGALMVYAIWGCLLVIIGTGIGMSGLPGDTGQHEAGEAVQATVPATASADDDEAAGEREEGPLGEVHEAAANLLYGLILLHIGGVIFESRRSRRNLALAMLPGRR
ncbi:cytochrome b/b6 domain-containing protein [Sandarakinorhabdus oryzae]|uniref:cytochrome b/b6 domain-containing protein n=1 Tax=Sandarakinorhabdus oryzae TaxID=2675220 RepID=UPI0018CC155F|nr:cytochrome b/b6 domain-containing protein [Sandarakinorhabdus oryzae]